MGAVLNIQAADVSGRKLIFQEPEAGRGIKVAFS